MSPLSSQREKKILEQVQKHGSVSIRTLAESLDVSTMTVHRDLNKLAAAGLVSKIHGEVILPMKPYQQGSDGCAMCGKVVSVRSAYIISLVNGDQKRVCCAHCGLMLQEQTEGVRQSMTTDFLYGHMISANHAFYVLQSELIICCAPSVLSFESQQDAQRFIKGFGGKVFDMKGAIQRLQA